MQRNTTNKCHLLLVVKLSGERRPFCKSSVIEKSTSFPDLISISFTSISFEAHPSQQVKTHGTWIAPNTEDKKFQMFSLYSYSLFRYSRLQLKKDHVFTTPPCRYGQTNEHITRSDSITRVINMTEIDRIIQKIKWSFLKYLSETLEAEDFKNAILRIWDVTLSCIIRKGGEVLNLLVFFWGRLNEHFIHVSWCVLLWEEMEVGESDRRSAIFQAFCGDTTEEKGSEQVRHCPEHQNRYCKWKSSSNPPV